MFDLPNRKRVQIAPAYFLILLFPLLVLTLSELLLSFFGNPALSLPENSYAHDPVKELTGRYKFLAAFLFYVVIGGVVTAVFLGELIFRHTRKSILYTALAFLLTIPAVMLFSSFEPKALKSFEAFQLLGGAMVKGALGAGGVPFCTLRGINCGDAHGFSALKMLTGITNNVAEITSIAVVLGMILALARPVAKPTTEEARARSYRYAQSVMKRYLYFAGVLLSAGMLMNIAWMSWPGLMITDPDLATDHAKLVQSIAFYRGVSYSLLILSYYVPVSLILLSHIDVLYEDAAKAETTRLSDALKRFGLERIGSLEALKAILAILSPILAAGFGTAFKTLELL